MALGNTHSFSSYTTITQEFTASSTAVITGGVGRGGLAGVVTNGTTFFAEDLYKDGQLLYLATVINGMALRVVTLPASGRRTIFTYLESGGTAHVTVTVDDTGIIEAYRGTQAGSLLASAADPIVAGLYYDLEVKVTIADSGGRVVVKLWTDAVTSSLIIDFTGDTRNAGTGLISNLSYGVNASSPIANWSDAWWCTSLGASFNDFLGNKHIAASYPTAPGAFDGWEPVPTPPNWSNVDEHPPDGDTSYNYAPAEMDMRLVSQVGNLYAFPNPPNGPYEILVTPSNGGLEIIHEGDLLLCLFAYVFGSTPAAPTPAGWVLLGEIVSGTGDAFDPTCYQLTTRLYWKIAGPSEPSTYTFGWNPSYPNQTAGPLVVARPGVSLTKITNVDVTSPIDDYANAAGTDTAPAVTLTGPLGGRFIAISTFIAVDAGSGIGVSPTPAGYTISSSMYESDGCSRDIIPPTQDSTNGESSILSKLVTTPQTSAPVIFPWIDGSGPAPVFHAMHGVHALAVRSRVNVTEEHDAFVVGSTSAPTVNAVVVKVLAKSVPVTDDPVTDRTVGVVSRFSASEANSFGVVPGASYHYIPFPLEQAANATSWTQAKRNASQFGYEIAAPLPPTYDLDVEAINPASVAITVSPPDNNADANGTTSFTRNYNPATPVTLTAPGTAGGNPFSKWKKDGVDDAITPGVTVVMSADHTMLAVYTGACSTGDVIILLSGALLTPQSDNTEITTWTEDGIHAYTLVAIEYASYSGPLYDTTAIDNIRYSKFSPIDRRGLRLAAPVDVDLYLPAAFTMTAVVVIEPDPSTTHGLQNVFNLDDSGTDGWLFAINGSAGFYSLAFTTYDGSGDLGIIESPSTYDATVEHVLLVTIMCDGVNVRMLVDGVELVGIEWFNNGDSSSNYAPATLTAAAKAAVGTYAAFASTPLFGRLPFFQINNTNLSDADRQAIESAQAAIYGISYTVASCSIGCA